MNELDIRTCFEAINNAYIQLSVFDENMDKPNVPFICGVDFYIKTVKTLKELCITIEQNLQRITNLLGIHIGSWEYFPSNEENTISDRKTICEIIRNILKKLIRRLGVYSARTIEYKVFDNRTFKLDGTAQAEEIISKLLDYILYASETDSVIYAFDYEKVDKVGDNFTRYTLQKYIEELFKEFNDGPSN